MSLFKTRPAHDGRKDPTRLSDGLCYRTIDTFEKIRADFDIDLELDEPKSGRRLASSASGSLTKVSTPATGSPSGLTSRSGLEVSDFAFSAEPIFELPSRLKPTAFS